jgi:hypothetical protein
MRTASYRGLKTLVVLSAVLLAVPAFASHSWGNYHWARTSNPFTLKVGNNLTTTNWTGHLGNSSADWSVSSVLDLSVVAGQSNKRCSPTAGRIEVCNGKYGQNGWLGLAQIWLSGGHISQGVAKMNDTYFTMSRYNIEPEKLHVMCQEVGHTFGLGHTSEDGSSQNTCMDYYSNLTQNDWTSTTPNAHDYQMLESIYSHADGSTTIGSAISNFPSFLTEMDLSTPGTWGRLVSGDANGRSETYELDLGDGRKIITHVYWAEEREHPHHD